jgi:hypothetical protein
MADCSYRNKFYRNNMALIIERSFYSTAVYPVVTAVVAGSSYPLISKLTSAPCNLLNRVLASPCRSLSNSSGYIRQKRSTSRFGMRMIHTILTSVSLRRVSASERQSDSTPSSRSKRRKARGACGGGAWTGGWMPKKLGTLADGAWRKTGGGGGGGGCG